MSEPKSPSNPGISLTASLGDYFREPITQAFKGKEIGASTASEAYLVQLLTDFAKPTTETASPLSQSVTFLLRDATNATGHERFKRLQGLGDGILYGMGFFSDSMRGADRAYLARVGASAYDHAARMLRTNDASARGPDVLNELACKFERFVDVLTYVADWVAAKGAQDEKALVKLYERWLRTGSTVLHNELGQRGLVAMKNGGGIH